MLWLLAIHCVFTFLTFRSVSRDEELKNEDPWLVLLVSNFWLPVALFALYAASMEILNEEKKTNKPN